MLRLPRGRPRPRFGGSGLSDTFLSTAASILTASVTKFYKNRKIKHLVPTMRRGYLSPVGVVWHRYVRVVNTIAMRKPQ